MSLNIHATTEQDFTLLTIARKQATRNNVSLTLWLREAILAKAFGPRENWPIELHRTPRGRFRPIPYRW